MFGKSNRIVIVLLLALCTMTGWSSPANPGEPYQANVALSLDPAKIEATLRWRDDVGQIDAIVPTLDKELTTSSAQGMSFIEIDPEVVGSSISALEGTDLDRSLLTGSESKDKFYVLENNLRITNPGSATCQGLKLEVPLMADIDSPYQELVAEEFSVEPLILNEADNGNRIGTFAFNDIGPGQETIFTQRYIVKVDGSDWLQSAGQVALGNTEPYLAAAPKIESNAPEIKAVASQIIDEAHAEDSLNLARRAFDFTHRTLKYDSTAPSANKGALAGLKAKAGVCEEFASLFVATCRASGVPARIVNGYASDVSELAGEGNAANLTGRRHQWAEFYLEGKGWIPADPTLTNSLNPMFGELPVGYYLAQNYGDLPIRGWYRGGQVSIGFEHKLAKTVGTEDNEQVSQF
ncbi:MAG: transglutaminase domain-containing protein [Syntrophomonadaceae bacterium]|nr:transglutaminase domain-containing protein [Syntrophomonadaceae bacterium]